MTRALAREAGERMLSGSRTVALAVEVGVLEWRNT